MSGIKEMTFLPSVISWQINVVLGTEMTDAQTCLLISKRPPGIPPHARGFRKQIQRVKEDIPESQPSLKMTPTSQYNGISILLSYQYNKGSELVKQGRCVATLYRGILLSGWRLCLRTC